MGRFRFRNVSYTIEPHIHVFGEQFCGRLKTAKEKICTERTFHFKTTIEKM